MNNGNNYNQNAKERDFVHHFRALFQCFKGRKTTKFDCQVLFFDTRPYSITMRDELNKYYHASESNLNVLMIK